MELFIIIKAVPCLPSKTCQGLRCSAGPYSPNHSSCVVNTRISWDFLEEGSFLCDIRSLNRSRAEANCEAARLLPADVTVPCKCDLTGNNLHTKKDYEEKRTLMPNFLITFSLEHFSKRALQSAPCCCPPPPPRLSFRHTRRACGGQTLLLGRLLGESGQKQGGWVHM